MQIISFKKIVAIFAGLIIMGTFIWLNVSKQQTSPSNTSSPPQPASEQNEKPRIVATKPDPLEQAIVSGSQPIELIFNRGLENEGELKLRIEPPIDMKITLSQDRKTATLTPQKPYELGVTYTIFIKGDSKFTGFGEWREEKNFHFQTVRYRGV